MGKFKTVLRVAFYSFFAVALFAALSTSFAQAAYSGNTWFIWNPFLGDYNLQGVIAALINLAFIAAGLVAVIYLIIGGFRYVTSSGNAEAIEGAKATILNAIIGLIVIFISFLLVQYLLGALGTRSIFNPKPVNTNIR